MLPPNIQATMTDDCFHGLVDQLWKYPVNQCQAYEAAEEEHEKLCHCTWIPNGPDYNNYKKRRCDYMKKRFKKVPTTQVKGIRAKAKR